ncbi:hypothetical protein GN956_G23616 [Arapaima gigas]
MAETPHHSRASLARFRTPLRRNILQAGMAAIGAAWPTAKRRYLKLNFGDTYRSSSSLPGGLLRSTPKAEAQLTVDRVAVSAIKNENTRFFLPQPFDHKLRGSDVTAVAWELKQ